MKLRTENKPPIIKPKINSFFPIPYVYIAAPFTSEAESVEDEASKKKLFKLSPEHGKIPPGRYRNMLLKIVKELKSIHLNSILPHRDVNRWGNKKLTSIEVMEICSAHVKNCSLFIGVMGESLGAHYEFGIAQGLNKPCIIIHCDDISNSFISKGITDNLPNTISLKCNRLEEIPTLITSPKVLNFIEKMLKKE